MANDEPKNKIEKINIFLEENIKKYGFVLLLVGISVIILIPIAIALGVTFLPFVSRIYGTSNAWIGFWGSFMGGILGTIGIIFVAYLQNKEQRDSMIKIEEHNMNRLLMQTLLDLTISYSKDLHYTSLKITDIQSKVKKIIEHSQELEAIRTRKSNNDGPITDQTHRHIDSIRNDLKEMKIPSGYVVSSLANLEYQNLVLSTKDFKLEEPLKGKEALYFDKIIDCLISSDYKNQKFYKLYLETQSDKEKNFGEVSDWLLKERTNISQTSTNLLEKLE